MAQLVKNPPTNAGYARNVGSIPGLRRFPEGGNGNPLQYFCLKNSYGQGSLVGYSPWGDKALESTEYTHTFLEINKFCKMSTLILNKVIAIDIICMIKLCWGPQ